MVTDHDHVTGSGASEPVVTVPRTRTQYFRAWSELHGGYDVHSSALVHGWLTITYVLARPLARARVAPTAVTAVGVLFAVLALAVAGSGPWGAGAAALLLVLSALVDSLDGAVALLRGRSTAFGYVADSVADRLSDMLVFAVLLVLGAPAPVVVAVALLTLLHETARARAVSAGMASIGVVTVWERPSRVIAVVVTLLGASVVDTGPLFGTIGAAVSLVLAVVGFSQISVSIHHALSALPAPRPGRTRE
ncbi:CDP-alcohol phosphatidyltransferase family protein [Rhodococcus sp. PvP016]|uniref:CDP-alcohol phosphatidyltransferase family protein n=1 Tax=Rhodococcus sp. PvP016 TaxID=2806601 RepID=UPI001AEB483D|nr:CDP-alcohol phosphatidyltransferase family protein [Rhodococcus sp. PvP016]